MCCNPKLLTRNEKLVTESTSRFFKKQLKEPIQELASESQGGPQIFSCRRDLPHCTLAVRLSEHEQAWSSGIGLGSNPDSTTNQLPDLGQIIFTPWPVSLSTMEIITVTPAPQTLSLGLNQISISRYHVPSKCELLLSTG